MSKDSSRSETGNRLIDGLPRIQAAELSALWEPVDFEPRGTVYRQGGPISHVYFPTSGCCCHVVPLDEHRQIEVTMVGNEGMLGIHLAFGLTFSPLMAVSLLPGEALRLPVRPFLEIMRGGRSLERLVKRYAAYCLRFASQNIACNTLHTVKQRVCRQLLMAHDRAGNDEFLLTHDVLGQMLGVRRQAITIVARRLQAANVIEYRRGVIKILKRTGLEDGSCQCYQIAKTAYQSIVMKTASFVV